MDVTFRTLQVVSLLSTQGTCAPGYGPRHLGTFDACIYSRLQQIMVSTFNALSLWIIIKLGSCLIQPFPSQMDGPGCTVPWLPDKSAICTGPNFQVVSHSLGLYCHDDVHIHAVGTETQDGLVYCRWPLAQKKHIYKYK